MDHINKCTKAPAMNVKTFERFEKCVVGTCMCDSNFELYKISKFLCVVKHLKASLKKKGKNCTFC